MYIFKNKIRWIKKILRTSYPFFRNCSQIKALVDSEWGKHPDLNDGRVGISFHGSKTKIR
jgi:hypothetical protein